MAMPPVLVGLAFLLAVLGALGIMAYLAWRGAKASEFFLDEVKETYVLPLPEEEIVAFYDMKDKLYDQFADGQDGAIDISNWKDGWMVKVPPALRQTLKEALMRRMVKTIDRLEKVEKDKPGFRNLWSKKLMSEKHWNSFLEAEQAVRDEIESCITEAGEIDPAWHGEFWPLALHMWRMKKQEEDHKKQEKKLKENEKKQKEKEERRKEVEARQAEEDKKKQERLAEKAMEQLLRDEEMESKSKKAQAKAKSTTTAKAKGKKK